MEIYMLLSEITVQEGWFSKKDKKKEQVERRDQSEENLKKRLEYQDVHDQINMYMNALNKKEHFQKISDMTNFSQLDDSFDEEDIPQITHFYRKHRAEYKEILGQFNEYVDSVKNKNTMAQPDVAAMIRAIKTLEKLLK